MEKIRKINYVNEVYDQLSRDERFNEVMDVLLDFAEKLRKIIWSMTEEGRKEWQEAIKKFLDEKHRIILLFAEIIEHLNW